MTRDVVLEVDGVVHPLSDVGTVVVGRRRDCDVVVTAGFVSRRHLELVRVGDAWRVRDLDSSCGTLRADGSRLRGPVGLAAGDVLTIPDPDGRADVVVRMIDPADTVPADTTPADDAEAVRCPEALGDSHEARADDGTTAESKRGARLRPRWLVGAGVMVVVVVALLAPALDRSASRALAAGGPDMGVRGTRAVAAVVSADAGLVLVPATDQAEPWVHVHVPGGEQGWDVAAHPVATGDDWWLARMVGLASDDDLAEAVDDLADAAIAAGNPQEVLVADARGTVPVTVRESFAVVSHDLLNPGDLPLPADSLLLADDAVVAVAADGCVEEDGSVRYAMLGIGEAAERLRAFLADEDAVVAGVVAPAPRVAMSALPLGLPDCVT